MSKWEEEFEKQHETVGKLKKETEEYKKIKYEDNDDKSKYWIHKQRCWGRKL